MEYLLQIFIIVKNQFSLINQKLLLQTRSKYSTMIVHIKGDYHEQLSKMQRASINQIVWPSQWLRGNLLPPLRHKALSRPPRVNKSKHAFLLLYCTRLYYNFLCWNTSCGKLGWRHYPCSHSTNPLTFALYLLPPLLYRTWTRPLRDQRGKTEILKVSYKTILLFFSFW